MVNKKALKILVVLVGIGAVPTVIALDLLTDGAITPHLPGKQNVWNIQYLLHALVSLIVLVLTVISRSLVRRVLLWTMVFWNLMWLFLAIYATFLLWGEKY